ncbi:MAG: efflux RND transporter periplasmic adaptor subunit [Zetaproteobacteria bacterium]|nr:efflux RND transporter periplasmic adaptor subunit [Zetaproteobacteria bacterium]
MTRTKSIALMVAVGSLFACSHEDQSTVTMPVVESVASGYLTLKSEGMPTHYVTSGSVTSDHRVSINARLAGYIRQMLVREGDVVKAGDVLVRIDPVDAKQVLIQAEADVADAKVDLDRYEELLKVGAVTDQQAAKVRLRYDVASSQLAQARNQLSYADVRSPVSGVVVAKHLSKGDLASPGLAILSIEDPNSLLVESYVSEQFVSQIQGGDHVDVFVASLKKHYDGTVRQIVQAADPVSHQFLVKIALPVGSEMHPGMYAEIGFNVGVRDALVIPNAAVVSQSGLHGVYVLDDQGISHYRQVRLGVERDGSVEVLAGLHAGDRLVWDGAPMLKSGMHVQTQGREG